MTSFSMTSMTSFYLHWGCVAAICQMWIHFSITLETDINSLFLMTQSHIRSGRQISTDCSSFRSSTVYTFVIAAFNIIIYYYLYRFAVLPSLSLSPSNINSIQTDITFNGSAIKMILYFCISLCFKLFYPWCAEHAMLCW